LCFFDRKSENSENFEENREFAKKVGNNIVLLSVEAALMTDFGGRNFPQILCFMTLKFVFNYMRYMKN
jgi:hypothetical protein